MAQLFDSDPSDFARVSIPILKFEEDADGSVFVYGKATDSTLDRDEQIIDPEFAAGSLRKWFETGANVRVMHSPNLYPAGKGVELVSSDDGQYLKAKVVEPTAAKLVMEGVLSAYSVGIARPRIVRDSLAKNGRVVGGETVEVSLVDRPANPSCGVVLAKMAGDEVQLLSETLGDLAKATKPADAPAEPAVTVGDVKVTPTDLADLLVRLGKAAQPDVEKKTLTSTERDDIDTRDFAYVDSDGGRHLPIHDESHVRNAVSRFDQTHFESPAAKTAAAKKILSRAKADGIEVGEDSAVARAAKVADAELAKDGGKDCTKCGKTHHADTDAKHCSNCGTKLPTKTTAADMEKSDVFGVDGMPDGMRRIHDATCAAYPWAAVKAAHPALEKNGVAAALGPSAMGLLYRMLAQEVTEDGGNGSQARDIGHLGKAYAMLAAFLADDANEPSEVVLAEARAELHKAFRQENPSAHLTPLGPGKNPDPHRFTRPYLSGGHASDSAKRGQHPRIPEATHVPTAEDFHRQLIAEDHEADSPYNTSGSVRPVVTSEGAPSVASRPTPGEKSTMADLTKDATSRAREVMTALHDHVADAYPECCPMVPRTALAELAHVDTLDTHDASTPKAASVVPELAKALDHDLVKAALAELLDARFAAEREDYRTQLAEQADTYETQLAQLRKQYEEIAGQPDPHQAPIRGMAGIEQLLGKRAAQEPEEQVKAAQAARFARWLDSPDPAQREAARSLLIKLANQ